MVQLALEFPTTDPNVDKRDAKRLTGQNAQILDRLRHGPATNAELAAISLKYTSRISDLRQAGFVIRSVRGDGGLWTYWIQADSC